MNSMLSWLITKVIWIGYWMSSSKTLETRTFCRVIFHNHAFRLCIHDRNFIPGDTIEDNIVRAIENSRKTILVLSKSFLTSEWCQFELQMARMEGFEQGRNLIITVMLESLPIDSMPKTLRTMVKKNTHIEWSDDPNQKIVFWDKMRRALNREQDEYVCECGSRKVR